MKMYPIKAGNILCKTFFEVGEWIIDFGGGGGGGWVLIGPRFSYF
jgi:hypothetical protein